MFVPKVSMSVNYILLICKLNAFTGKILINLSINTLLAPKQELLKLLGRVWLRNFVWVITSAREF